MSELKDKLYSDAAMETLKRMAPGLVPIAEYFNNLEQCENVMRVNDDVVRCQSPKGHKGEHSASWDWEGNGRIGAARR